MAETDNNKPNAPDTRLERFHPIWDRVDACLAGTDAMREAAEEYLPQYPAEHDDNYGDRLAVSTFFPAYKDTLDGVVGMVFRKPPKLGDGVPAQMQAFWADIDLQGTHGDVFAQRLFRSGVHRNAAYIVVDMQRRPETLQGQILDGATAKQLNLRPYWVRYSAKDLAQMPRYVVINGKKTLQQIVFKECATAFEGDFGTAEVERRRVWRLPVEQDDIGQWQRAGKVIWQVWEEDETGARDASGVTQTDWVLKDAGNTSLDAIPVAPFLASTDPDDDTMFGLPPLNDLSHAAIEHWQVKSDQGKVLRRCIPVPFTVNLSDESRQAVNAAWGVDTLFHCDQDGMLSFAEPTGNALSERREWLNGIRQELRDLGLSLVVENADAAHSTATKERLDLQARSSKLSQMARALKDCLDTALFHTAAWLGVPQGGEITLGVKDVDLILTAADVAALNSAVKDGNLSLRTMWATLARGGWTPDDFKAEVEMEQIKEEQKLLRAAPEIPQPVVNGQVATMGA